MSDLSSGSATRPGARQRSRAALLRPNVDPPRRHLAGSGQLSSNPATTGLRAYRKTYVLASAEVQTEEMVFSWSAPLIFFALGAKGLHDEVAAATRYLDYQGASLTLDLTREEQ
jgi:hypothetical protein